MVTETNTSLKPKRITITLPSEIYEGLATWAEDETRPLSNLLTAIATKALKERTNQPRK
ncbi:ribbon-helix-helix domain-containing protein [Merismopedia glauca]|uniref:CopG-like ribbon-helix-helix domain-containing protein n=1 Tax=Merismopedia glauca CCAP 1448/3 TaxID=1296344 RepID=A0A2T1C3S7_9CYAN|nr:hypothetical protein [Merismopedia glauca]PSB02773.1 hypothetical protein C7B64_11515 [Merismopedia glauca CCAP 1448/3]